MLFISQLPMVSVRTESFPSTGTRKPYSKSIHDNPVTGTVFLLLRCRCLNSLVLQMYPFLVPMGYFHPAVSYILVYINIHSSPKFLLLRGGYLCSTVISVCYHFTVGPRTWISS
jgi:hypothetical protein